MTCCEKLRIHRHSSLPSTPVNYRVSKGLSTCLPLFQTPSSSSSSGSSSIRHANNPGSRPRRPPAGDVASHESLISSSCWCSATPLLRKQYRLVWLSRVQLACFRSMCCVVQYYSCSQEGKHYVGHSGLVLQQQQLSWGLLMCLAHTIKKCRP